jgi:hypothetical protein
VSWAIDNTLSGQDIIVLGLLFLLLFFLFLHWLMASAVEKGITEAFKKNTFKLTEDNDNKNIGIDKK